MTPLNLKNLKNFTVHIFIHTLAGEQPLAQCRPRPAMVAEACHGRRGLSRPRRAAAQEGGEGRAGRAPGSTSLHPKGGGSCPWSGFLPPFLHLEPLWAYFHVILTTARFLLSGCQQGFPCYKQKAYLLCDTSSLVVELVVVVVVVVVAVVLVANLLHPSKY